MDRLQTIEIYVRVAQTLSFSRTAEQLQIPRSAVSQAVQQLEQQLRTRLLYRTTRKIQLTADGATYLAWAQQMLVEFDDVTQRLRAGSAAAKGKLRLSAPGRLVSQIIAPHLADFTQQYPEIELELLSSDRPVDLIKEGIDCVVRVGDMHDDSLILHPLGTLKQGTYASADYLARYGEPESPAGLSGHRAIRYLSQASGREIPMLFAKADTFLPVDLPASVAVNCTESYIACCLAGLGLIQIPRFDAAPSLANGKLQEVLAAYPPPELAIAVLYPDRRYVSRRLRVFIDWMKWLFAEKMQ